MASPMKGKRRKAKEQAAAASSAAASSSLPKLNRTRSADVEGYVFPGIPNTLAAHLLQFLHPIEVAQIAPLVNTKWRAQVTDEKYCGTVCRSLWGLQEKKTAKSRWFTTYKRCTVSCCRACGALKGFNSNSGTVIMHPIAPLQGYRLCSPCARSDRFNTYNLSQALSKGLNRTDILGILHVEIHFAQGMFQTLYPADEIKKAVVDKWGDDDMAAYNLLTPPERSKATRLRNQTVAPLLREERAKVEAAAEKALKLPAHRHLRPQPVTLVELVELYVGITGPLNALRPRRPTDVTVNMILEHLRVSKMDTSQYRSGAARNRALLKAVSEVPGASRPLF